LPKASFKTDAILSWAGNAVGPRDAKRIRAPCLGRASSGRRTVPAAPPAPPRWPIFLFFREVIVTCAAVDDPGPLVDKMLAPDRNRGGDVVFVK